MKYFVIRVKMYEMLSNDYTVSKVLEDEQDAHALAAIFTRMDNDPSIVYIVAAEQQSDILMQPAAVPAM